MAKDKSKGDKPEQEPIAPETPQDTLNQEPPASETQEQEKTEEPAESDPQGNEEPEQEPEPQDSDGVKTEDVPESPPQAEDPTSLPFKFGKGDKVIQKTGGKVMTVDISFNTKTGIKVHAHWQEGKGFNEALLYETDLVAYGHPVDPTAEDLAGNPS